MRRADREVTDFSRMLEVVSACECCRIGLVDGNEAYIVPVNFGYEASDGHLVLYFHGATEGRKMELLEKQGVVSFEMDRTHGLVPMDQACGFSFRYECVMGKGTAAFLTTLDGKAYGLQKIMGHYTHKEVWDFDPAMFDALFVVRLDVEDWSCKING